MNRYNILVLSTVAILVPTNPTCWAWTTNRRISTPLVRQQQQPQLQQDVPLLLLMSSASTDNILEDSEGHVNRDLAERIFNWEQANRKRNKLAKVNYSIRSGLRLVDATVEEVLDERVHENERNNVRSDLVQEGLSALLDAMSHYRHDDESSSSSSTSTSTTTTRSDIDNRLFEVYARRQIYNQLVQALDDNDASRPIRLPKSVKRMIQKARQVAMEMKSNGKSPHVKDVAAELGISKEQLQDYLKLARAQSKTSLSMERTVEIYHPQDKEIMAFADQDDWELQQGMLLDTGRSVQKEELVDEFLDETVQNEGDDEAWIRSERIAGPLYDLIPDDAEFTAADADELQEIIQNDLSGFLDSTLNPTELRIVKTVFGVESSGKETTSVSQAGDVLNMKPDDVARVLRGAISKLQTSYQEKYMASHRNDNNNGNNKQG